MVIALPIIGLIYSNSQYVAMVNGTKIRLSDYEDRARFWYYLYYTESGSVIDSWTAEQRRDFFAGIVDEMIDEVLVRQEAKERGISVTREQVQIEMEETWFQHFRTPLTPTPTPTPDPEAVPTEESTPLPTATPDTEETFRENYKRFKLNVLNSSGMSESSFRKMVEISLLKEELMTELVPEVPTEEDQIHFRYTIVQDADQAAAKIAAFQAGVEEQVHARHILVGTQEEAADILRRLDEGEDFAALAAELSLDSGSGEQGGDLGWFSRGQMVAPFEEAAFDGEIGVYPFPVQSEYGFHVIEILAREERPIDIEEAMVDVGWYGKSSIADRWGPLFAEMLFNSEVGLITNPVPIDTGVAVVEILEREVRPLDEQAQEQQRYQLFQAKLDEMREGADVENLWSEDLIPTF